MLPAPSYSWARRRARFHIQGSIVPPKVDRTSHVPVTCHVERVFRGREIRAGDTVQFTIPVARSIMEIPPGADLWTPEEEFKAVRDLEAFLNGQPPDCELALCQWSPIDELTERPQLTVLEVKQILSEWRSLDLGRGNLLLWSIADWFFRKVGRRYLK